MALCVLIIDDDPVIRTLLEDLISAQGARVTVSATGGEGLAQIPDGKPDLVFLDYQLPDQSGIEVLKAIRANAATSKTKVVLFSASSDTKKDAERSGIAADWYLKKPFELHQILEILKSLA